VNRHFLARKLSENTGSARAIIRLIGPELTDTDLPQATSPPAK